MRVNEVENTSNVLLDHVMVKLCDMVLQAQIKNPDHYGMVAAAVIDPQGRIVAAVNHWRGDKRVHGERAAMERYEKKYGTIPRGSTIVTTCSPCTEPMPDREGESCQDLINSSNVTDVYAGYRDPSQDTDAGQHSYHLAFTKNSRLQSLCQKFAETWLRDQLNELSFLGSECTKDCSGHRAGYYWSARKGNVHAASWSPSFNKGAALRVAGK